MYCMVEVLRKLLTSTLSHAASRIVHDYHFPPLEMLMHSNNNVMSLIIFSYINNDILH